MIFPIGMYKYHTDVVFHFIFIHLSDILSLWCKLDGYCVPGKWTAVTEYSSFQHRHDTPNLLHNSSSFNHSHTHTHINRRENVPCRPASAWRRQRCSADGGVCITGSSWVVRHWMWGGGSWAAGESGQPAVALATLAQLFASGWMVGRCIIQACGQRRQVLLEREGSHSAKLAVPTDKTKLKLSVT